MNWRSTYRTNVIPNPLATQEWGPNELLLSARAWTDHRHFLGPTALFRYVKLLNCRLCRYRNDLLPHIISHTHLSVKRGWQPELLSLPVIWDVSGLLDLIVADQCVKQLP